jgi:Cellulase (glycosyl hydrolase family 5)
MRARGNVVVIALVAALAGFAQLPPSPAIATASPAPTPVVVGNRLVDSRTNTTFVPHGANWPSFEYACSEGWGYSQDDDTAAAATAMASWQINTVRIPLNENCWLGSDSSDYGTAAGYRAAVLGWVTTLNAHGIVAILDLHFSAPVGAHALGQWPMPDAQSPTFWTSVATAYAGNASVMFDAFNEPYSIWNGATETFRLTWECWENGGCSVPLVGIDQQAITGAGAGTYTAVGMSTLVAAIRAGHASQPIMLGGLDYSNNLAGWLAHKPNDSQLVASWHNYQGQLPCGDTVACWNAATDALSASVPIVTGEFGETDGSSQYMTSFMNWADSKGIGYLPWAWWSADGLTGDNALYALYSGATFTPHAPAGTNYRAHLLALPATTPAPVFTILPAPMTRPSAESAGQAASSVTTRGSETRPSGVGRTSPAAAPLLGVVPASLAEQRYLRVAPR